MTWRNHNPGMKIRMVNDSHIKDLVPDLPEEYFQVASHAARWATPCAGCVLTVC